MGSLWSILELTQLSTLDIGVTLVLVFASIVFLPPPVCPVFRGITIIRRPFSDMVFGVVPEFWKIRQGQSGGRLLG